MKSGIEGLTLDLLMLQDEKRLMEGAIKDLQVTQRQLANAREHKYCEEEIAILGIRMAEVDVDIATRERVRREKAEAES